MIYPRCIFLIWRCIACWCSKGRTEEQTIRMALGLQVRSGSSSSSGSSRFVKYSEYSSFLNFHGLFLFVLGVIAFVVWPYTRDADPNLYLKAKIALTLCSVLSLFAAISLISLLCTRASRKMFCCECARKRGWNDFGRLACNSCIVREENESFMYVI